MTPLVKTRTVAASSTAERAPSHVYVKHVQTDVSTIPARRHRTVGTLEQTLRRLGSARHTAAERR